MTAWQGGGDFFALLKADAEVTKAMSAAQIEACVSMQRHAKAVDEIFGRVVDDDQSTISERLANDRTKTIPE